MFIKIFIQCVLKSLNVLLMTDSLNQFEINIFFLIKNRGKL